MVEFFGENLAGFVFTEKAWVQSYGTRCVKPPIIFGDVKRIRPITVEYSAYAQSLTDKPVKGMLPGPVTILNWSFPREDISLKEMAYQIGIAIREEVLDLEKAGISIIQIDEAALKEKLPIRKSDWYCEYLEWAIPAFRLCHSGVKPETQIHTHMCYIEFNDIIHEITVRPGEVHHLPSVSELKVDEGEVIKKGTVIAEGIKAKETSIVTIMDSSMDDLDIDDLDEELDTSLSLDEDSISNQPIQILVRPVQVLEVEQKNVSIKFNTSDDLIDIVPVTQLQYKDGARVRNLDGSTITRTSLVLQMQGYLSHLKGMVELDEKNVLKFVVLENLIVRREFEGNSKLMSSLQTELLVKDGQTIDAKTPVAKTQVLSINDGVASINAKQEDTRRLLLTSATYETVIPVKGKASVKKGDFVKLDSIIADGGEKSTVSGMVTAVNKGEITIRNGRPYLISPGTMLQGEAGALVLRGDIIATLVFERQKTGDIVQGLPRVEELLEGRKPKDCAILAEEDGVAEMVTDEDLPRLYLVNDNGRTEIKYAIDANIIVQNKQQIKKGQPLTSGPLNPHDVIRLCGPEAAQQYLVDEVQRVYRSQGVEIADKHVEIIVRQMTKKVKIVDAGDTTLLPGELVEMQTFEKENSEVQEKGGEPATCEYMLLGITKASLNTESFISAASFQETTRILTEAAVDGKKDLLRGLKENVIIGRLIPAGTGFHHLSNANEE